MSLVVRASIPRLTRSVCNYDAYQKTAAAITAQEREEEHSPAAEKCNEVVQAGQSGFLKPLALS